MVHSDFRNIVSLRASGGTSSNFAIDLPMTELSWLSVPGSAYTSTKDKTYSSWRKSWHQKNPLLHRPEQVRGRNWGEGFALLCLGVHVSTHLHWTEGTLHVGWPFHSKRMSRHQDHQDHQDSSPLEVLTSVLCYQMPQERLTHLIYRYLC